MSQVSPLPDAQDTQQNRMKGLSILEVVLVFTLLSVFGRLRYAWLDWLGASFEVQRYVAGILMIVFPVAIIWLTRRS
nr:hypothetical protein [Anaerolineae bacterium]